MVSFVIVTPSYNQASFLRDCLESVEHQKASRTHIVIDAQSQDGSQKILKEFSEKNLSYTFQYVSEEDNGQSHAINKGFAMADGDIFSWLNSDDMLCSGALERVAEAFNEYPDIDFVYGDCEYIDQHGHVIGSYPVEPYDYKKLICKANSFIPQPACFIRKTALRKAGALREDLHYVMDLDLWLRLGAIGKGLYIPHLLAYLRLHSEAKSLKALKNFDKELIQIYQDFFLDHQDNTKILALERRATHHVFTRAADIAFWSGQYHEAWQYAVRSFCILPMNPNKLLLRLLLFSWLAKNHLLPAWFTRDNNYLKI